MKKAFTIVELLVAMTIIVIILAGSGYVFKTAVQAERISRATAEISRKLRGITDQLNADFKGLRKEGEIFNVWEPSEVFDSSGVFERYARFDQMMFFSNNNVNMFSSYGDNPSVKGDIARIQYSLAVNSAGDAPGWQEPSKRILTRVQHFQTAVVPAATTPVNYFPDLDPATFYVHAPIPDTGFLPDERDYEFDNTTMDEWKKMDGKVREQVYSVISNVSVDLNGDGDVGSIPESTWWLNGPYGVSADASDSKTIHKILCEGVGEFIIQTWRLIDPDGPVGPLLPQWRWWPENDPTFDGDYTDTDFYLDASNYIDTTDILGWIHPGDDTFFNFFGDAFKFTFTLYDSYGIFPDGKTFSHIIYLK